MSLLLYACAACAPLPDPVPIENAASCTVTDGDTIRCGDERIRLLAIDAPELPGHCRHGRVCVEGDGHASTQALEAALGGRTLTIRRAGKDRYGRTLAEVFADGENASCLQVRAGQAVYVKRWDNGGRVARQCPDIAG